MFARLLLSRRISVSHLITYLKERKWNKREENHFNVIQFPLTIQWLRDVIRKTFNINIDDERMNETYEPISNQMNETKLINHNISQMTYTSNLPNYPLSND